MGGYSFVAWMLVAASGALYLGVYFIDRTQMIRTARKNADAAQSDLANNRRDRKIVQEVVHNIFQSSSTPRVVWLVAHVSALNFIFDLPGRKGCGPGILHGLIVILNTISALVVLFCVFLEEPLIESWGCYWGYWTRDAGLDSLIYGTCNFDNPAKVCSAKYHGDLAVYNVPGGNGVTDADCSSVEAALNFLSGPRNIAVYILLVSCGIYFGISGERANDLDFHAAAETLRI